jgi:nucleotide-binding universal stress UspA family protein
MGMSHAYGPPADRNAMIALLRTAVERGVNFFDTAEVYGPFTNESLVGEALSPLREQVVIATKFGFALNEATGWERRPDSRPEQIKAVAEASLKRLRTDVIEGRAARVLVHESRRARMLVVGARGRDGFTGMVLGSVSTACAQHAHCPVLIVRGEGQEPD